MTEPTQRLAPRINASAFSRHQPPSAACLEGETSREKELEVRDACWQAVANGEWKSRRRHMRNIRKHLGTAYRKIVMLADK